MGAMGQNKNNVALNGVLMRNWRAFMFAIICVCFVFVCTQVVLISIN